MKTLQKIKDDLAVELNWKDYTDFLHNHSLVELDGFIKEVCRRAQLECARETLKEASENAEITFKISPDLRYAERQSIKVKKSSITDDSNIKLVE